MSTRPLGSWKSIQPPLPLGLNQADSEAAGPRVIWDLPPHLDPALPASSGLEGSSAPGDALWWPAQASAGGWPWAWPGGLCWPPEPVVLAIL